MKFNSIEECEGAVISEYPYVKLLTQPKQEDGIWTALAQVNDSLCFVELKVTYATNEKEANPTPEVP